jgi:hypothetical protein
MLDDASNTLNSHLEFEYNGAQEDSENQGSGRDFGTIKPIPKQETDKEASRGKGKKKIAEEEIIRLINEEYQQEEVNKDVSVILKDNKLFDQPKKAVYGI